MTRAVVIGLGGLGCPAALGLAESGIGELLLVDPDTVELSNLQRQVLYRTADVGRAKVEVATQRLSESFSGLRVEGRRVHLGAANARELLRGADVVVDCTDDPGSRFIVNDVGLELGIPTVLGGVLQFDGLVLAVSGHSGPCFRCLFEVPPPTEEARRCGEAGVLGPLCGVVGHLQAQRAWGLVSGHAAAQTGFVTTVDGLRGRIRDVPLPEATDCPACGGLAARLDITPYSCPMTYVRTRLALETLNPGQTLDIVMRRGEPSRNVPRNLLDEGHDVLINGAVDDGRHRVVVRRVC